MPPVPSCIDLCCFLDYTGVMGRGGLATWARAALGTWLPRPASGESTSVCTSMVSGDQQMPIKYESKDGHHPVAVKLTNTKVGGLAIISHCCDCYLISHLSLTRSPRQNRFLHLTLQFQDGMTVQAASKLSVSNQIHAVVCSTVCTNYEVNCNKSSLSIQ